MEKDESGWYSDEKSCFNINSSNLYKSINGLEILNEETTILLDVAFNNGDTLFDLNDIYEVFSNKIEDSWFFNFCLNSD